MAPSPFAQIFKETIDKRPKHRFSLAFIFGIGNANCRMPLIDDQPEMLDWLHKDGRSMNSALVRCTRALRDMPHWKQDEDSGQKDLMFLGEVKQKVANIQSWRPHIHQLFLHVGTLRHGQGAKQRLSKQSASRKGQ